MRYWNWSALCAGISILWAVTAAIHGNWGATGLAILVAGLWARNAATDGDAARRKPDWMTRGKLPIEDNWKYDSFAAHRKCNAADICDSAITRKKMSILGDPAPGKVIALGEDNNLHWVWIENGGGTTTTSVFTRPEARIRHGH